MPAPTTAIFTGERLCTASVQRLYHRCLALLRRLDAAALELARRGNANVPDEPDALQASDHQPREIDLAPVKPVARGGRERVVVVVPALPEHEQRDEPVVARLVARAVVLAAEHVTDRVHRERRVLVEKDPDQPAPDHRLEAERDAADEVADQEWQTEGERDPDHVQPVDPDEETVGVEVASVHAALLHAEVREQPADVRMYEALGRTPRAVAVSDMRRVRI